MGLLLFSFMSKHQSWNPPRLVEFSKFSKIRGGGVQIFSIKMEGLLKLGVVSKKRGITYFHTDQLFLVLSFFGSLSVWCL